MLAHYWCINNRSFSNGVTKHLGKMFLEGLFMKALIVIFLSLSSNLFASGMSSVLFSGEKGVNTDAVIIQKDGEIIYEKYARGYDKNSKHLSWSTAKTIAGILVGQAIEDGKLKYGEKLSKTFPDFQGNATILDVLQMSSGIKFKEGYSGIPVNMDVTKMLYLKGPKKGFGPFTLDKPLNGKVPGDYFYYSSGDTNILMEVLKKKMSKEEYDAYPWTRFFTPLGIDATFEQDSKGTFVGSSYIYMTPRNFLKIGALIMNKGVYKGKQIIPTRYFDKMSELAKGVEKEALEGTSQTRAYSMQVTTNLPITGRGLAPEYKDLPSDSILLIGHQGQLVIASPSQKLVIVRLATDKGRSFRRKDFFSEVKSLIKSKGGSLETASETHASLYKSQKKTKENKKENPAWYEYAYVPKLLRSLAAKEYCSCIFVLKRSKKQCREDLKASIPIIPFLTNFIKKKSKRYVTAHLTSAAIFSKAVYVNDKVGCRLTK